VKFVVFTVVVVPDTVRLPEIVTSAAVSVPVNVGAAFGAFKSSAVCVAVETGLLASEVLSTFPRPTEDFVSAATASATLVSAAEAAAVIASDLAVATVVSVARTEVSAIPCTLVVSEPCVETASSAYVFVATVESMSNLSSTVFQSIPVPASAD
jgi:hypothetical protein